MGGDVGRAFKETLSLEEFNLTNCGGYKLKGLRVARLSGTNKVYDGPHRVPSTPKRHVEIQMLFSLVEFQRAFRFYTSNKISKN